jgi:hypothetical protein
VGKTSRIAPPTRPFEEIDPRLRGLVSFFNRAGPATVQSCEGHDPNYLGYVEFTPVFFKENMAALKKVCETFEERRIYTEQKVWVREGENALFFHLEPMNGEDAMGLLLAVIGEEFDADERWQTIIRSGEIPDQEEI